MGNIIDITGQRFGRWVAIRKVNPNGGESKWECKCDCGTVRVVRQNRLRNGTSKSCGCLNRDISKAMSGANSVHWKGGMITKECPVCGKGFSARKGPDDKTKKYCSVECRRSVRSLKGEDNPRWKGGLIEVECKNCGKKLKRKPSQLKKNNNVAVCNQECLSELRRNTLSVPCSICGKLVSRRASKIRWESVYCGPQCQSEGMKNKTAGANHYRWDTGMDRETKRAIRNSREYKEWRGLVFQRDDRTCGVCEKRTRDINAHHIRNFFSVFMNGEDDLMFDTDNGITLCVDCHKAFHKKYGRENNNEDQLWEFIANHEIKQI